MNRFKKVISVLMATVLILTLIPPIDRVSAAPNIEIQSWATAPDNGNGTPNWSQPAGNPHKEPSRVTTKNITLDVDFTQIADDDLSKLYYQIYNANTRITKDIKDNQAIKVGSQQVRFENVELSEGLNKITVILDTASKPQSLPAWITYTEVATISNLTINNRVFTNGIFVPDYNPIASQTSVYIEGVAPNSTQVKGHTYYNSEGQLASFFYPATGEFAFIAGERNVDLRLRPGDNDVSVIASNPSKTYRADRSFVYNNGQSFLFNTDLVGGTGVTIPGNTASKLFKEPTVTGNASTGTFSVNIKTDVKINRQTRDMTHKQINISINNSQNVNKVVFSNLNENGTTGTVDAEIETGAATVTMEGLTLTVKNDYYIVHGLELNGIDVDLSQSRQELNVDFVPVPGASEQSQMFVFYYTNTNNPYIESARLADGTQMYSGIEINITTTEIEIYVTGKNSTSAVEVYTNHQTSSLGRFTETSNGEIVVRLNKNDIPEGASILKFVPVGTDNNPYFVGAKEYLINYNPAPYVYVSNIFNGQIFTTSTGEPRGYEENGTEFNGPVLQIKPVNIPESQWGDIRVRLNDRIDKIRKDEDAYPSTSDFKEFRFKFGSGTSRNDWTLVNGRNLLTIEVYPSGTLGSGTDPGNVQPITTFKYDMYLYSDTLPEVHKLDLTQDLIDSNKYTRMDGQDFRYYTQESSMQFETAVRNTETIRIIVNRKDEDGEAVTEEASYKWNGSSFGLVGDSDRFVPDYSTDNRGTTLHGDATIVSFSIPLHGTGTNSVEVIATNESGLFSSRMMEIVREPATFIVHYPIIDPISKLGTVNGNFTQLYIEAEGADKIIVDKNTQITNRTEVQFDRGESKDLFIFDVTGLKKGNNKITFTIVRGNREDKAEITLVNVDTPISGAVFKDSISKGTLRAFNKQIELKFPKGTVLRKNDENATDQFLSPNRSVLIGIADPVDGRVNKVLHPLNSDYNKRFATRTEWERGAVYLTEQSNRFKAVSPLYWIDAGMVSQDETLEDALYGGGNDPYSWDQEFYKRTAGDYGNLYVPSQSGTLTLAYDPNVVKSAWRYVTVFHYGYNEDYLGNQRFEWKNIGGVVNSKNNTITVPIQEFGYYRVMYMDYPYDDMINHPWARDYLETLFSKGMMKAKEQNRFETNEAITRGEFATLLVKAFELPLNYEGPGTFRDVVRSNSGGSENHFSSYYGLYEYKYIETAARAGIIRGTLGASFRPNDRITREDAAVMIARAANLKLETNADKAKQQIDKIFTDVSKFGDYTIPAVLAVNKAGYIDGKPNNMGPNDKKPTYYFDPKANLTRAEAAAIMMRVMLKAKKIPSL